MQKQSKTQTLFNQVYEKQNVEETAPSILDEVIEEPVGTSIEEVFEYNFAGTFDVSAVHPEGKCGSTSQYDVNYHISLSFNKQLSTNQLKSIERYYIKHSTEQFSKLTEGKYYWKGSCEEIANHLVVEAAKISVGKMKPVEIVVSISPNAGTIVQTKWQDHMKLPNVNYCANPKYATSLPEQYYRSGCG